MNVLYVRVVEVEVLELAGVISSWGAFTEFVVDGDRLEIIIEITIWVFSHPLRKSRGIIELRDEKMETFALQTAFSRLELAYLTFRKSHLLWLRQWQWVVVDLHVRFFY